MRMVTVNGNTYQVCGDEFSDVQIAVMVRMLMRDQLDHEAVCTMGRDRILHLAQTRQELRAALTSMVDVIQAAHNRTGDTVGIIKASADAMDIGRALLAKIGA